MTAADLLAPPLAPALLAYSLCVVFAAGIVRGFAGFGFSAITVAGMSLVVSPALVVPAIFMLEVLASLSQLRGIARDIDMALAELADGGQPAVHPARRGAAGLAARDAAAPR